MPEIATMLLLHGIPPHYKGYLYIKEAVQMLLEKPERIVHLDGLYKDIAKTYNTTPAKVEKGIFHAISKAWEWCPVKDAYPMCKGKAPGNGLFLALITERIRCQKGEVA